MTVPRAEHPLSRRDVDPDALKVLYRLQQFNYTSYLVGGSVRDLLLGRRPKDFDVGTSAHPYQIKKLFRNCWIIGRRFRLAHVRFGSKTIEVATFRRHVPPGTENDPSDAAAASPDPSNPHLQHDNTFGTPEQDAFRRDFTVNALFYDIATFSIIDYVNGLDDLAARLIRSIGDPLLRFQEDPVRMFRAVAFAARLDFALDSPVVEAIRTHRALLGLASPARLIEEYYKVLRSGAAEKTFRGLAEHGLLQVVTPELHLASGDALWPALAALDRYRQRFERAPATLTNAVLLGSVLVPLRLMPRAASTETADAVASSDSNDTWAGMMRARRQRDGRTAPTATPEPHTVNKDRWRPPKAPLLKIGLLPVARRDTERLRQVLALQRRLHDIESSSRAKRALLRRSAFGEALTWLDIHGGVPEAFEHWRGFVEAVGRLPAADEGLEGGPAPAVRARRGRRRSGRRRA